MYWSKKDNFDQYSEISNLIKMLKKVILRQKQEREQLLFDTFITRTKSKFAQKWLNSKLIKVILGPRRAGKSVFAFMLLKNQSFMYFNFDDELLEQSGDFNTNDLIKELHAVYGSTKTIFFDEIQNLPKWELFVNRLQREGYNLILTGSNARLLSKELATALTGRHMPIEILPFNFQEYLQARKHNIDSEFSVLPQQQGELMRHAENYMKQGGFPEIVVNKLDGDGYLDVLLDAILFKDIVKRHQVKLSSQIASLSSYLINNFSGLYSLRRIQNILGFKSVTTTEKFTSYLEEAYIIFSLLRYSAKAGERVRSPKKVYVVDNGFVSAKAVQHSPDMGKLMENLIFTELVKKGKKPNFDLFYYKTRNDREIDFLIKKGSRVDELIQVVYQTQDAKIRDREEKALFEAVGELKVDKLTLITWDEKREIQKDGLIIKVVPLFEWLMKDN